MNITSTFEKGYSDMCLKHLLGCIHWVYLRGRGRIVLGGDLQFFEGKREDSKNVLRQEGGIASFLNAIERLSMVTLLINLYTSEVPYFVVQ